jgi:alanyl aminopeptidase
VVELLVVGARDPETTRVLAALGRAYAGGDGRLHPEAVTPELAPVALAAAVMEGDAAFGEGLEARLATLEDGELRGRLLDALGAARNPAGAARALGLAGDPRLRPQERARTLFLQAGWPETRDLAWRTVETRWDALAAALLPRDAARLPDVAAPLCDASRLPALRRFLDARAPRVPGASRHAAEALERVELCAALRAAQGASAAAWVEKQRR